jgi:hypothetical protein
LAPEGTPIAVVETGGDKRLASAVVPGLERRPIKATLEREIGVMKLPASWRNEAEPRGARSERVWATHPASVAVRHSVDQGGESAAARTGGGLPRRALDGFVKSLIGRLGDERLSEHLFQSLPAARRTIEFGQTNDTQHRPHKSLNGHTPFAFVNRLTLGHNPNGPWL